MASIITGVLVDLNIVNRNDLSQVVDRSLVRRIRSRIRAESMPEKSNISSIYFDSKIDTTLQKDKTLRPENHVTILNEPGCEYIGHKVIPGHSALDMLNGIVDCIPPEEFDSVLAIGADGTNTNTGSQGGVIALIERKLKRKCHWIVSLLRIYINLY